MSMMQPRMRHHHVDEQQDNDLVGGDAEQSGRNHSRDLQVSQKPAEHGSRCDKRHDHGDRAQGLAQDVAELAQRNFAVNKEGDDEGVNNSDSCGLSCGEPAEDNAADDDDAGHETEQRILRDLPDLLDGEHSALGIVTLACNDRGHDHQRDAEDNARDKAAHEQLADGNAAACRMANRIMLWDGGIITPWQEEVTVTATEKSLS